MASPTFVAATAQRPVEFPLSGPPVCVAFRHPSAPGCMRVGTGATFIELAMRTIHPTTMAEKFYLEPSQQHKGLVHVRSCGNNKYWVAEQHERDGRSTWFISSTANEPEEDLTKPSCTLFEFTQSDHLHGNHVRVIHQQQKKPVLLKSTLSGNFNLEVRDPGTDMDDIPQFIRVCRLSIQKQLPRYVAFKGSNGKYLTRTDDDYLQFSLDDIANPAVVHETFTDEYGTVRIISHGSDIFWRLRPEGWIRTNGWVPLFADYEQEAYSDVNILFRVDILRGNYVAIQSRSSGLFCTNFTNGGKPDCLSALVDDIESTIDAQFEIAEPVKSRDIYDVRYRYDELKETSTKREPSRTLVIGTNRSDDAAQSQTTIEQYERVESRWDATLSFDVGIRVDLKASVPILKGFVDLEASIGGHANFAGEYKWGELKMNETKTTTVISYAVAPKTRKICTIFAAKKVVEVPFSYKRKDVLYNGKEVHSDLLHDGVYRGMVVNEIDYDITGEHIE